MRRYEILILISDRVEEADAVVLYDRAKDVLTQQNGTILDEAWWGKRKLAYEIDHRDHGFYGVIDFLATTEAVAEVERQLKIADDVVRFKTVRPEVRVRAAS